MNINIDSIKKYFSKKDKDSSKTVSDPHHDWWIANMIFIVAIIFMIVYTATSFLRISDDSSIFIIKDKQPKVETINRSTLINVLDNYEQKEVFFEELKANRPKFVDPS